MLLGTDPEMTVAPATEVAKFLHFGMVVLFVVLDWEVLRIIYPDVAAQAEQYPGDFVGEEHGVGPSGGISLC